MCLGGIQRRTGLDGHCGVRFVRCQRRLQVPMGWTSAVPLYCGWRCCGLNAKCAFTCLNTWSPAGGIVWEGYGTIRGWSFVEDVYYLWWALRFYSSILSPLLDCWSLCRVGSMVFWLYLPWHGTVNQNTLSFLTCFSQGILSLQDKQNEEGWCCPLSWTYQSEHTWSLYIAVASFLHCSWFPIE